MKLGADAVEIAPSLGQALRPQALVAQVQGGQSPTGTIEETTLPSGIFKSLMVPLAALDRSREERLSVEDLANQGADSLAAILAHRTLKIALPAVAAWERG